jgi:hypothetical protein
MYRYYYRFALLGLLVVSSLVGSSFHFGSAASASEPQFSAAATLIEQSGQVGTVYMSAMPALCVQYSAYSGGPAFTDEEVHIYPHFPDDENPIGITASPGRSSQKATVRTRLYQRLANGSYLLLKDYFPEVVATVTSYPESVQPSGNFLALPAGPDYVLAHVITWYAIDGVTVQGQAVAIKSEYTQIVDGEQLGDDRALCDSRFPSTVALSATSGTVNSPLKFWLDRYPVGVTVDVTWDGKVISSTETNDKGQAFASVPVPASPLGPHKLTITYGHWTSTATYTVKPD